MPNPHTSAAIAQVVFYAPMVPVVIYLFWRNARIRPLRLAGGIVTILAEQKPDNTGLWIAALILLNVGVVPLIVANLGLTRLIIQDNHADKPTYHHLAKVLRLTFVAAILLLAAGGGTASVSARLSRALTLAGYVVLAAELVLLTGVQVRWWWFSSSSSLPPLLPSSRRVLVGALLPAAAPLALRTAYGLLEVAAESAAAAAGGNARPSPWNPLTGSAVAFALMALLPEYVVLVGWVLVGFSIPPRREVGSGASPRDDDANEPVKV
ncbi:hypothetical protein V2A60_002806 [Cordyceps javanica]